MSSIKGILGGLLLVTLMTVVAVTSVSAAKDHDKKKHEEVRPPEKIERAHARQQGDAINLRWHAVKGPCDGYRVYHEAGDKLLPGSFWYDVHASQTTSLFSDVKAGGIYTFRVSALYGRLEGPPSAPVTVHMREKTITGPSDTAR